MKITITINMDNAAFQYGEQGVEVSRILQQFSRRCEEHGEVESLHDLTLHDINGNTVGKAKVVKSR